MRQYSAESGIKVLDRAVAIMHACAQGPLSLAQLCDATDLPRATVHRLASALEVHELLSRTPEGWWQLGTGFGILGSSLIDAAKPTMQELVEITGESVQLYQQTGQSRTCVAAAEPPTGLRNTVPVGSRLPLTHGSAAKVVLAFTEDDIVDDILTRAAFTAEDIEEVRRNDIAESVAEREPGLASLSAPVRDSTGAVVAVLSISGPADRLRPSPIGRWGNRLLDAAAHLSSII
ncbi:IclR family transcriptional regulator [Corynebacterium uterequi]|nr:IclR family transcriptional regulator [Corynebacterium uterequi]